MKPLELISLGAGVQSSTLALMAAYGEFEYQVDAALFADTGAEPKAVYEWLSWLEKQLPFPVYRLSAGDLATDQLEVRTSKKTGNRYLRTMIPAYIDGAGLLGRKCTADYKVRPLTRKARQLAGIFGKQVKDLRVYQWLGISLDEIQRMKVSQDPWMEFRHPLIDKRMTREDCLQWMSDHGFPEPPRSACLFCPFHSNKEWLRVKENPEEWQYVIDFERKLQEGAAAQTGTAQLQGLPYLHASRVPIDQVVFDSESTQMEFSFLDECAGMCGV